MEIGLQDAIGTIHTAKRSHVQNLIAAAIVFPSSGAGFDKGPFVFAQYQSLFPPGDRIITVVDIRIGLFEVVNNLHGGIQAAAYLNNPAMTSKLLLCKYC